MELIETLSFMASYPNSSKCLYQYFDDTGRDASKAGKPKRLTEESLSLLKEKNDTGSGIFFTVNGFDTEERKKDQVTTINAWIAEIDGISKEAQMSLIEVCPIRPSLIIESKNSYHLYWYAKEGTIENWELICNGIRNFFDSDPNVITLERVLRLPGFYHKKDVNAPFMIEVVECQGTKYTEEEMLAVFHNTESVKEKKQRIKKQKIQMKKDDGDFWSRVADFDSEKMLLMLSGTKRVNGEDISFEENYNGTKQIYIDGQSTGAWLDNNGMIGSKTGGGPTRIQWILWYGSVDWKDLYTFLIDKFPELKKEQGIQKKDIKIEYDRKGYLYGNNTFDEIDCMMSGELVTVVAESNAGKTTRAMNMLQANKNIGKKGFYINLEFKIETVAEQRRLTKNGKTKKNLTDLEPLTTQEQREMEQYVALYLERFDYYNNPDGLTLEELTELILEKQKEGYNLFVLDTFSRIKGNLEGKTRDSQNKCMEGLQALVQNTGITLVMLHHTNKDGKFEGSKKIFDLSNVFMVIQRESTGYDSVTTFTLTKDKYVSYTQIYAKFEKGDYKPLSPDDVIDEIADY